MKNFRRLFTFTFSALFVIALTGCPQKVDVSPEDDASKPNSAAETTSEASQTSFGAAASQFQLASTKSLSQNHKGTYQRPGMVAERIGFGTGSKSHLSNHLATAAYFVGEVNHPEVMLTGHFDTLPDSQNRLAQNPLRPSTPVQTASRSAMGAKKEVDHAKTVAEMIQRNGKIFTGWQKPLFTLIISGEQNGYIEPCGCAGLENQKGGLKRRHTLIKELNAKGWNCVPLDLGGQVKRFGTQAEIKFRHAINALIKIGYRGVGFGPKDLRMEILSVAAILEPEKNPFVSANVAIVDFDSGFTKPFVVMEAGGKRIGVTSILGKKYHAELKKSDVLQVIDVPTALKKVIPKMQAAKCDCMVLLSFASPKESTEYAKMFPVFDFVVTAGAAEEPPEALAKIPGTKSKMVEIGHKGMYVAAIGFYDNPQQPFRYQRVPLDARFKDSPEMNQTMIAYQQDLETLGLEELVQHGSTYIAGRKFVGSQACAECHQEATEVFLDTTHSHATQTLIDLKPPRHFDPECLSCHVTGWNPQKFFPYKSGYLGLKETPKLRGNGCENCHGPGSAHVAAEDGTDEAEKKRRRDELHLKIEKNEGNQHGQAVGKVSKMCAECHDLDNSPEFNFQEYWKEVEHHGME